MVYPEELEKMMFIDIKNVVMSHLRPQNDLLLLKESDF